MGAGWCPPPPGCLPIANNAWMRYSITIYEFKFLMLCCMKVDGLKTEKAYYLSITALSICFIDMLYQYTITHALRMYRFIPQLPNA